MGDARRPVARHTELARELSAEIASRYPIGGRFPSEQELQERFSVGRHTVREALKVLTEQGMLGRRRKAGTVVLSHHPVDRYVHTLRDLKGLLDFAEYTVLDVRSSGFISVTERGRAELGDLPEKRWFRIAGLRLTRQDMQPLCWSEIFVPARLVTDPQSLLRADRAVYETVLAQEALKLEYVEQDISATELPASLRATLNATRPGALLVKRRYVAHNGAVFEVSFNMYPAGRYSVKSVIRQRA